MLPKIDKVETKGGKSSKSYVSHSWKKGFLDLNFSGAVIDKISTFHKNGPNFTYSQNYHFLKSKISVSLENDRPTATAFTL